MYKEWRKKHKKKWLKKRITWGNKCRELKSHADGRKASEAWKLVKNIRNDNGEMLRNNLSIKD